jgi:hypothetical protein
MKRIATAVVAMLLLGVAILVAFPEVEDLSDHCLGCGLTRTYLMMSTARAGEAIYNLETGKMAGYEVLNHHHGFCDAQSSGTKRVLFWTLHKAGRQQE